MSAQSRFHPTLGGHRRVAAAIAGLSVALAAAGCGSASAGGSSARLSLLRAADVTNAAAGYRANFQMTLQTASLPGSITASGTGRFTPASHIGEMTLAMNFGSNPQVTAALGGSTLALREIVEGKQVYLGLPASLAGKIPGGRPWLRINLAQAAAQAGIPGFSSLLNNPTSSNPAQFLQYLRAVSGGVRRIGTATIDGRATTGYRATIDLSKAPSVAPAADRSAARQAIAAIERLSGIRRVPVEVWIDGRHFVRRMRLFLTEHVPSTGQQLSTAVNVEILSYGPQPKPQLPPASQVTNLGALIGGRSGA